MWGEDTEKHGPRAGLSRGKEMIAGRGAHVSGQIGYKVNTKCTTPLMQF